LFSIWQQRLARARFLDLFCGSGAAGLEALSRGAGSATLVDDDGRALATAARNRDRLGAEGCRTVRASLPPRSSAETRFNGEPFDLVFADPPYEFDQWAGLLDVIERWLAAEGEAAIEHSARAALPERVGSLQRFDTRRYGDTAVSFYRRSSPVPE
jgi:16S rRNA (guanine(966)-N(2))-methyltransferase RsmD